MLPFNGEQKNNCIRGRRCFRALIILMTPNTSLTATCSLLGGDCFPFSQSDSPILRIYFSFQTISVSFVEVLDIFKAAVIIQSPKLEVLQVLKARGMPYVTQCVVRFHWHSCLVLSSISSFIFFALLLKKKKKKLQILLQIWSPELSTPGFHFAVLRKSDGQAIKCDLCAV